MSRFWEHYTDPIPEQLLTALESGSLVAFIGAGLSRRCLSKTRAPLPDWSALLETLVSWGGKRGLIDADTGTDLNDLLSRNEFLMVAQECRELLGDRELGEFITQVFDPDGVVPARVHELLSAIPFSGYITTNYDNLLERAHIRVQNRQLNTVPIETADSFFASTGRNRPLLKLHGDFDTPASIVLGHRDYLRLIWSADYGEFVRTLLSSYTLLFVGYGLTDLDILLPLDQLVHEGSSFKHFLMSRRGARNAIEKKRMLKDRQIQLIEYVDYFGYHNHADTFLEGLLVESSNGEALARVRTTLRARIHVHYATSDESDGLFVWHYLFREGAVTMSQDPQERQWQKLKETLADGFAALDHLVFLVTPQSLEASEVVNTIAESLSVAETAGVLVVFLAVGFDSRPKSLATSAPGSPIFLLRESFSETDLEPFRQFLAEDIKGGHRQP